MVSARGRQESQSESRKEEWRSSLSLSLIHFETFARQAKAKTTEIVWILVYPQHVTDTCSILGQIKLGNQVPFGSKIRAKKPRENQNAPLYPQSPSFILQERERIIFFLYFLQECACVVVNPCVSRKYIINLRPSHPWYCSNYILQNGNMHTEQDTSSWRLSSKVFKSMEKWDTN